MQTVVLISPTNSTPSQSQKHDLWEGKTCQWLTDSLSLSLSLSLLAELHRLQQENTAPV